jgi:hypothetical protein
LSMVVCHRHIIRTTVHCSAHRTHHRRHHSGHFLRTLLCLWQLDCRLATDFLPQAGGWARGGPEWHVGRRVSRGRPEWAVGTPARPGPPARRRQTVSWRIA